MSDVRDTLNMICQASVSSDGVPLIAELGGVLHALLAFASSSRARGDSQEASRVVADVGRISRLLINMRANLRSASSSMPGSSAIDVQDKRLHLTSADALKVGGAAIGGMVVQSYFGTMAALFVMVIACVAGLCLYHTKH